MDIEGETLDQEQEQQQEQEAQADDPYALGAVEEGFDIGGEQEQEQRGVQEGELQTLQAPASWSSEDQETFNAMTPKAQHFLANQVVQVQNMQSQAMQEIQQYQNIIERVNGYAQHFNADPAYIMDQLFTMHNTMTNGTPQQKIAALRQMVSDYGIAPVDAKDAGQDNPQLAAMERRLAAFEQGQQHNDFQAQQAQQAQIDQEVQAFANAVDEKGNLLHPYLGDVEREMAELAQISIMNGYRPNLQELYDRAVWSNPQVRAKAQAAEVSNARRKSTASPGTSTGAYQNKNAGGETWAETLEKTWDQLAS